MALLPKRQQLKPQEKADLVQQVKNKKILALDQATQEIGWSFYDEDQLIDFGHWTFSQKDIAVRIAKIYHRIEDALDEYEPDLVVFEDIQMQQGNVATFQKLAWLQGVILLLCQEKKVAYKIVRPSEWRSRCNFLKGNDLHRASQKKIAQDWVFKTYGMKCTEDEADAICIGYSEIIESAFDWS